MTRKPRQPLLDSPRWVRQRQRTDGTWRVWWEPPASLRKHGLAPVDLPADNPRAALRQAQQLNAAADAALAGGATAVRRGGGRTIEDLAQAYRASPHSRPRLAAKTRASYDGLLRLIVDKWGHRRAADMDKPVMLAWYAALAEARGLRQAQALVRMMSILMELAEAMGWRVEGSNPCSRLRTITPPPRARVVGWAEFDALVAAAEGAGQPALALAMRLGLYTGQRQTDILRARRGAFALLAAGPHRGRWVWRLVRSKRGTDGAFPIHPDLLPALRSRSVPVMAYSPLGQGAILREPALAKVAGKHAATPAQIALAWVLRQPDVIAIPKSASVERTLENAKALEIVLDGDDLKLLDTAFPPPGRASPLAML